MKILINNKSGQPIYDQIYTQLKDQIIHGEIKEDESLPSIRESTSSPQNGPMRSWKGTDISIPLAAREALRQKKMIP